MSKADEPASKHWFKPLDLVWYRDRPAQVLEIDPRRKNMHLLLFSPERVTTIGVGDIAALTPLTLGRLARWEAETNQTIQRLRWDLENSIRKKATDAAR